MQYHYKGGIWRQQTFYLMIMKLKIVFLHRYNGKINQNCEVDKEKIGKLNLTTNKKENATLTILYILKKTISTSTTAV